MVRDLKLGTVERPVRGCRLCCPIETESGARWRYLRPVNRVNDWEIRYGYFCIGSSLVRQVERAQKA